MSSPQKDKHAEVYREEAFELLGELETSLLELEENPGDIDLISRVFRAMHTIKGSGAMFGFDEVAAFTHDIENVFDLVRKGRMEVSKELIDLTLAARDQIRQMLEVGGGPTDEAEADRILESLRGLIPEGALEEAAPAVAPVKPKAPKRRAAGVTYRIRFTPPKDIFLRGVNPVSILDDLRSLGPTLVIAHTDDLPKLSEMNPDACYASWDIILTTEEDYNAIQDVFIFIEEESRIHIEVIDEGGLVLDEQGYKKLGEILVERGDISARDIEGLMKDHRLLGEMLVERHMVDERSIESALSEQQQVKNIRMQRWTQEEASSIRVASSKLDKLVDLVGELVTVQARLTQLASIRRDSETISISEEIERLSSELHDNTMSIRMVPIGTTFSKFRRLVRDLSRDLGREVVMTTAGGETELDKTVIERLNDPLVHIIRNSIDHGIEPPGVREAAGKPYQGAIHLEARHSGHNVVIEISDDGAGLDQAAIRSKAIELGLLRPDEEVSSQELYNMIFAPGFTTLHKATEVSGRGVGMDVVRQGIDALQGQVEVSSRKGIGTTVTLSIPLTLAIVEGLLVKLATDFYIIPLAAVEECVELSRKDIEDAHGRNLVNVRGEMVPYLNLRERFSSNGETPELQQVVVLETEGLRVGFLVDQVIGGHQTVIKSLGRFYREVQGFSGATILGDGTVALILDVAKLVHSAEIDESEAVKHGGFALKRVKAAEEPVAAEAPEDIEEADDEVPAEEVPDEND